MKTDVFPKGRDPDKILASKVFRQGIKLVVHRDDDDSKITDALLAAGAAPDKMSKAQCELWLKDIQDGNFSVRLQTEALPEGELGNQLEEQHEEAPKDDEPSESNESDSSDKLDSDDDDDDDSFA